MSFYYTPYTSLGALFFYILGKIMPLILLQLIPMRLLFPKQINKIVLASIIFSVVVFSLLFAVFIGNMTGGSININGYAIIFIEYLVYLIVYFSLYKGDRDYLLGLTLISLSSAISLMIFSYIKVYLLNFIENPLFDPDVVNWYILLFWMLTPLYKSMLKRLERKKYTEQWLHIAFAAFMLFASFFHFISIGYYHQTYSFPIMTVLFVTNTTLGKNFLASLAPNARFHNGQLDDIIYLAVAFVGIIFLVILCVFLFLFRYIKKDLELAQQREIEYELLQYTASLESLTENIRKNQHDFNNILISLGGIIHQKEIDQQALITFFDEINDTFADNYTVYIEVSKLKNIANPQLKSLLFSKIMIAKEQQMELVLEVEEPIPDMTENIIDLLRILGILLDNAIEAAAESADRILRSALFTDEQGLMILIMNSTINDHLLDKIEQRGYTTKGAGRGLGLSIVHSLLKKNEKHFYLATEQQGLLVTQKLRIRQ